METENEKDAGKGVFQMDELSVEIGTAEMNTDGILNGMYSALQRSPRSWKKLLMDETVFPAHVLLCKKGLPCTYFEEAEHNMCGEKIEAFDVGLRAEAVAVIGGFMATYSCSEIVVYKWDEKLRFKKTRTIKGNLLHFLARTGNLDRKSVLVLMQMLLFLIKRGTERCDLFIEKAMIHLEIGNVLEMEIVGSELHCRHNNFITRVYDRELKLLRKHFSTNEGVEAAKIVYKDVEITVEDDCVVIDRKRSFLERIEIEGVRQFVPVQNKLFLLTEGGLKVLKFF